MSPATMPPTNTTFGWRSTQRCSALADVGPIADRALELGAALVDEVVADVRAPRVDRVSTPSATRREVDRDRAPTASLRGAVRLAMRSTTWR